MLSCYPIVTMLVSTNYNPVSKNNCLNTFIRSFVHPFQTIEGSVFAVDHKTKGGTIIHQGSKVMELSSKMDKKILSFSSRMAQR